VPKGTPKDVIAKLNDAVVKARNDPATHKRARRRRAGVLPADMNSPRRSPSTRRIEIDKWWPVIKAAGIKVQQ
jgi:tripartite-type tricarboxylate transporter receptor subunit TctC